MLEMVMVDKLQRINGVKCRVISPEILEVNIYSTRADMLATIILECYHTDFKSTETGYIVIPNKFYSQLKRINKELDKRSHKR